MYREIGGEEAYLTALWKGKALADVVGDRSLKEYVVTLFRQRMDFLLNKPTKRALEVCCCLVRDVLCVCMLVRGFMVFGCVV